MDKFELYYHFVQSQLLEQDRRWQAIEVKARSFMTISAALLGITGVIIASFVGDISNLKAHSMLIGVLVFLTFGFSFGFSIRALYIRSWRVSPNPERFQDYISDPEYTDSQITEWTADAMTEAYAENNTILRRQGYYGAPRPDSLIVRGDFVVRADSDRRLSIHGQSSLSLSKRLRQDAYNPFLMRSGFAGGGFFPLPLGFRTPLASDFAGGFASCFSAGFAIVCLLASMLGHSRRSHTL